MLNNYNALEDVVRVHQQEMLGEYVLERQLRQGNTRPRMARRIVNWVFHRHQDDRHPEAYLPVIKPQ